MPEQSNRYDFIVTGASSNVGRHLVPLLASRGGRILAADRDAAVLRTRLANVPGIDTVDYDGLAAQPACDTLIHLAVRNDDQPRSPDETASIDVNLTETIWREFNRMSGRRFVRISSTESLDNENASLPAGNEVRARRRIAELVSDRLDDVHIGQVHGTRQFGVGVASLSGLSRALKPNTSATSLADYISGACHRLPAPGILTDDMLQSRVYRTATRTLDIAVALGILIVLLPVLLILWALIRLDSPGPAIFAQTRVGKEQSRFTLYKFRTMKRDTVSAGTHEVSVSAVTRIGKFLRGTKLDELPQAINLLRGEMTLVGPRPCLPTQEELLEARAALGIYTMKPGITGYAQIREIDMSQPQKLANSDYIYMKLQSLSLNFSIILLTAFGRGGGDRVASNAQS